MRNRSFVKDFLKPRKWVPLGRILPRFPGSFDERGFFFQELMIIFFLVFSVKAAEFLHGINADFFRAIEESGMLGKNPKDTGCQEVFPECLQSHLSQDSYRFPGRNLKIFTDLLNKI